MQSKSNFAILMNEQMILRCIQLAELGQGYVAPNPMVGALIVHENKIIAEGWHHAFGQAHAEVDAINKVNDQTLLKASTLFVNLEPCCHQGKTPACTDFIINMGIPKVVIGMIDPFSEVNGKGILQLNEAGIETVVNVCEKQSRYLNRRFITFHTKKRPYIILKWAQSADGFIGRKNETITISNHLTKVLTHQWRSAEAAVMVGAQTIITDNPQLNVRNWFGKNPLRITIDKKSNIPAVSNIFDSSQPTLVFADNEQEKYPGIEFEKIDHSQKILLQVVESLFNRNIQSVLVEGGANLLNDFIAADLFDEIRIFKSPMLLGHGIAAPKTPLEIFEEETITDNRLLTYKR